MEYRYRPQGVCSTEIIVDVENNIIKDLQVINGCNGNLKGISSLVKGMTLDEVISRLRGINCGMKGTSCPDQIAIALEKIKRGEWKKEDSIKSAYHPFGNNNIVWNDIYRCWLSIDYFDGSVIDGYNDDNRPDGAEIVLHNGRGTITWSKKDKKWNIEMKSPWK